MAELQIRTLNQRLWDAHCSMRDWRGSAVEGGTDPWCQFQTHGQIDRAATARERLRRAKIHILMAILPDLTVSWACGGGGEGRGGYKGSGNIYSGVPFLGHALGLIAGAVFDVLDLWNITPAVAYGVTGCFQKVLACKHKPDAPDSSAELEELLARE